MSQQELKVHQSLYDNLLLLTHFYPPSKAFREVFKKDMFVKNNKEAFHEVIYYLFCILDPNHLKAMVPAWPMYDVKQENRFRADVVSYIAKLNATYKHADVPNMMASHLISPGGFKFALFMFKLSQLALIEHFKRDDSVKDSVLFPIKPTKNKALTELKRKTCVLRTEAVETKSLKRYTDFKVFESNSLKEAIEIVMKHAELTDELCKLRNVKCETIKTLQEQDMASYSETLLQLETELQEIESLNNLSQQCQKLMLSLLGKNCVLQHDPNELKLIPDSVRHLVQAESNDLDLITFFKALQVLLEQENLRLEHFNESYLCCMTQITTCMGDKFAEMCKRLNDNKAKLSEAANMFQPKVHGKNRIILEGIEPVKLNFND